MDVFGYIFLAREKAFLIPAAEQQLALQEYAQSIGLSLTGTRVERTSPLHLPFHERPEGGALLRQCGPGDTIITLKTEWILISAVAGDHLLSLLGERQVALHCVDLGANISLPEKRRLLVSVGSAELVKKLLAALSICENSRDSRMPAGVERHRKPRGEYHGGPVPFGWEVNGEGFLVENEAQQQIIGEIETMRAERWSYRKISGKLRNEFNIRLSHEGVRKILAGKRSDGQSKDETGHEAKN
ncbi:MAG: hypothetical protein ACD_75C02418G0003 [uncultured bacterium]|nr:MAG: hypothetical protein ACD_75C02418G0003 [uncultured bacterium]